MILYDDLIMPVIKRKHDVPKAEFVEYLRSKRTESGLTMTKIAQALSVPKTEVDHWFRTDKHFSVPNSEIWFDIKRLLGLDDRYDDMVTEFIEVDGVFEKAGRCYWTDGLAPTITSTSAAELIFDDYINEKQTKRGRLMTTKTKPFKYISLFAGIGGFDFGLNAVGGECVFASEIDKFATQSYGVLHDSSILHGDITKIDEKEVPDHDVLAAGFPCQAFSVAGKRGGFEDSRGTLFFEVARIAKEKQPKVLLLENVKGLVGHDKGKTLDTIVKTMNEIGYRVDFEVLNSKYFGVPQNRERIFIIGIREDLVENEPWTNVVGTKVIQKGKRRISEYEGVKTFNFAYPEEESVQFRLVDILESDVDEKYYLSEDKTAKLVNSLKDKEVRVDGVNKVAGLYGASQAGSVYDPQGVSPTVDTAAGGNREPIITESSEVKGYLTGGAWDKRNESIRRVYGDEGVSPTLTAGMGEGGGVVPKIQQGITLNRHEISGETDLSHCLMARDYKGLGNQEMSGVIVQGAASRTRNGEKTLELNGEESANALTSAQYDSLVADVKPLRIRKLTPKECWRLQGFTDEQHDAVEAAGISNSQRYKQAGNAVTVNVIQAIGERLLTYI